MPNSLLRALQLLLRQAIEITEVALSETPTTVIPGDIVVVDNQPFTAIQSGSGIVSCSSFSDSGDYNFTIGDSMKIYRRVS